MRSTRRVRSRSTISISAAVFGVLLLTGATTGCESMTPGQTGAAAGAALGSGIAMVAGGGVAATVGAGLIGGAAGYLGGSAIGR